MYSELFKIQISLCVRNTSQSLKIALTGWSDLFETPCVVDLLAQLSSALTMMVAGSEIFEYIYQSTRRHILEDGFLNSLRHENLAS
jgi:hypothetical protein